MKNSYDVYCFKSNFLFHKNNIYKCKHMSISKYDDPLDPLLYEIYSKEENTSIPYKLSSFPKYFISLQELRKQKLQKISELCSDFTKK